jgi:hypothetical protein
MMSANVSREGAAIAWCLSIGFTLSGCSPPRNAAVADRDLEEKVARLEKAVESLQAENRVLRTRVSPSEGRGKVAHAVAEANALRPAAAGTWLTKSTWRNLRYGMTSAEVEAVLGPATNVRTGPAGTEWGYLGPPSKPCLGQVFFNAATMTVAGWNEPVGL